MSDTSICIELSDISFKWPAAQDPLLSIDHLTVYMGERIFIQGSSGSGKSTFLNILTGVLLPNSGTISILGEIVNQGNHSNFDQFRADHFGIIFQQFNLIPYLSVLENITLPLSFSSYKKARLFGEDMNQQALTLLDNLGLPSKEYANKNITQLSTGQQQRAAVARALIGSPEIVIADEPTSALDYDSKHNFLELLFNETRKTRSTVIFVSHDQSLSTMFDRTIYMNDLKP